MTDRYYLTPGGFVVKHGYRTEHSRPVVVIDPTDREQVERLARAYCEQAYQGRFVLADIAVMQNVLRSLIAPPKPEEPLGLGAVVEDAEGDLWLRDGLALHAADIGPWWNYSCADRNDLNAALRQKWDDLNAVRVLSTGVQP